MKRIVHLKEKGDRRHWRQTPQKKNLKILLIAINHIALCNHSHKKWKDSLEDSLNRALFAAKLMLPILVPRLLQNTSNVNTAFAGKSKQLYSFYDKLLRALMYLHFIVLTLICLLIDYAWCELCNIRLILFNNNSRSFTIQK